MRNRLLMTVVAGSMVVGAAPAFASHLRVQQAAESADYGQKAGGMLGRGLLSVATCFVDIVAGVVNETKKGPPFIGTLVGVAKGAGCGVLRAASGVVDVATFWVPGFNGMPVGDTYGDCMAGATQGAMAPNAESAPASSWESQMPAGYSMSEPAGPSTAGTTTPTEPARKKWTK